MVHMTAEAKCGAEVSGTPTPGVFVRADSKGLAGALSVRAKSKGISATECAPLASARGKSGIERIQRVSKLKC